MAGLEGMPGGGAKGGGGLISGYMLLMDVKNHRLTVRSNN